MSFAMLGLPERKDCIRGLHPGCSIRPGRPLLGGNVRLTVVPPQPDNNTLTELGPEAIITNLLWCFSHLFTSISFPPNPKKRPLRQGRGLAFKGRDKNQAACSAVDFRFFLRRHQAPAPPDTAAMPPRISVPGSGTATAVSSV